jgi:hypothetical protein
MPFSDFGKEPLMRSILRRAAVPVLLLIAGLAAVVCGAKFHSAQVWEERETETTIAVPEAFPPGFGEAAPFGRSPWFPGADAFGGPPAQKAVVKRKVQRSVEVSEPALMREASIGGVALTASGELKRTYSGKAPSLCPT